MPADVWICLNHFRKVFFLLFILKSLRASSKFVYEIITYIFSNLWKFIFIWLIDFYPLCRQLIFIITLVYSIGSHP